MKQGFERWRKNNLKRPYTGNNSIEWIQSGERYFRLFEELIDSARFEVHLQTFIFEQDLTGTRIVEALIRAARRQVEVFILVDAYGSSHIGQSLMQRFVKEGIQFRKFGKIYSGGSFHIGRRLHHKILVIDGTKSLVGGINISDYYSGANGKKAWLDFAVLIQGGISRRLQYICRKSWNKKTFSFKSARQLLLNKGPQLVVQSTGAVRISRNDFTRNKFEITLSYREAFRSAEQTITLVGGYFLPGGRTRRLLKNAVKRGVKIDVIVSEKSDVKVLENARRYLYNWLLKNGVNVYEYLPSNVHGKVIVMDDKWISIGSYDLNNLSSYSNIELNVDVIDDHVASKLASHLNDLIKTDCRKVTSELDYKNASLISRFFMWVSYRIVKTLFVLSFILAGAEETEK